VFRLSVQKSVLEVWGYESLDESLPIRHRQIVSDTTPNIFATELTEYIAAAIITRNFGASLLLPRASRSVRARPDRSSEKLTLV